MNDILWQLQGVRLGNKEWPRLGPVTLTIRQGTTGVIGNSGSGKTSLLNLLVGFEKPDAGRMDRGDRLQNGAVTSRFALPLYWVPQDGGLWPHLTVRDHLRLVMSREEEVDWIPGRLEKFDLAEKTGSYPHQLSQGERARLSVVRALATRPAVLVMDEPLVHVDSARAGKYWEAIRETLADTGAAMVFSTHAPQAVLAEATRVICLREGAVLYEGEVEELYWRPASADAAACLGETNWLTIAEAKEWLGVQNDAPRCYRPEQIEILAVKNGSFVVKSSRFQGTVAEVELEQASGAIRKFYYRPPSNKLQSGDPVEIKQRAD